MNEPAPAICKECGAGFTSYRYNPAQYCSSKCRAKSRFICLDYDTSEYIAAMRTVERIADRHCIDVKCFWQPRFQRVPAVAAARKEAIQVIAQAYGWAPRQLGAFFLREHWHICALVPNRKNSKRAELCAYLSSAV